MKSFDQPGPGVSAVADALLDERRANLPRFPM
jgi:hypothetical protein